MLYLVLPKQLSREEIAKKLDETKCAMYELGLCFQPVHILDNYIFSAIHNR